MLERAAHKSRFELQSAASGYAIWMHDGEKKIIFTHFSPNLSEHISHFVCQKAFLNSLAGWEGLLGIRLVADKDSPAHHLTPCFEMIHST